MRWPVALAALIGALPAAPLPAAQSSYGFAVGTYAAPFVGGDSGPVTPVSETRYTDTFGTGLGLRLEAYRRFQDRWRGQVGLVYATWSGKFFTGGEFPAGAQFGDLSLAGIYIGGRVDLGDDSGFQPYLLGNLGVAHLSSLSVVSGGTSLPYWSARWRDLIEIGAGLAKRMGGGTVTLDLRLQTFGAPEPATWPIASATAGSSLLLNVGYEWDGRR